MNDTCALQAKYGQNVDLGVFQTFVAYLSVSEAHVLNIAGIMQR